MKKNKFIIIGIDEAGRGPLAGPLCVAGVATQVRLSARKIKFWKSLIPKIFAKRKFCAPTPTISKIYFPSAIRDSKKLSMSQREEWRKIICKNFKCAVIFIGPKTIDKIGISKAAYLGVSRVLQKLHRSRASVMVLLDGSLFAPKRYRQQTIIKGDEKIPLIAAASVIAKTSRDAKMLHFHKKFPRYFLNKHKGYGTKLHYKMLKKYGFSEIHRRSFCKNLKSMI